MPSRPATVFLLVAGTAGYAARQPPRDASTAAHLRAGCYRCLQERLVLVEGRLEAAEMAYNHGVTLANAGDLGVARGQGSGAAATPRCS